MSQGLSSSCRILTRQKLGYDVFSERPNVLTILFIHKLHLSIVELLCEDNVRPKGVKKQHITMQEGAYKDVDYAFKVL